MKHLSICSGIGGLDLPFGSPDAVAETDKHAPMVLDVRFADAPNLGDWTQLDSFEGYDLLTGGLPCQPVSGAGRGKGDKDERYLYDDLIRILSAHRVSTLVLENVRGFLYPRHGELFWRLIRSLANLGYVGRYGVVRASDAGAPHRRERWFCVARHADTIGRGGWSGHLAEAGGRHELADAGDAAADPDGERQQERTQRDSGSEPRIEGPCGDDAEQLGVEAAAGADGTSQWGDYGPAIARWEHVLGRPAPAPLDGRRLSPPFVEWMMGFPPGWVTDLDLPRTAQLKMLGNAVVPQQAALAIDLLEQL